MENTINFEPALGYVCLQYPDEIKAKLYGKVIIPEATMQKMQNEYFKEHGSIGYDILSINGSDEYKVGDRVFIDGNTEVKAILKPKEDWKKIDVPEFDTFLFGFISQIQGKLK